MSKGRYNLYEVTVREVVPAPSYGVRVEVEKLLAENLEYSEALEEAGQQALHHQRKCRIREQA